jgi:hypothetical protein
MLYHGILATNLSGKIGGSVWSHNRGGPYVRANGTPTGGPTAEQEEARNAMGVVVSRWRTDIDSAQRELWRLYSVGTPRPNRIGDRRPIGALAEYVRANVIRQFANTQAGTPFSFVDNPPPIGKASATCSLVTVDPSATASQDVNFTPDDPWNNQGSEGRLLLWFSPIFPQTINWFRGPWTLSTGLGPEFTSPTAVPFGFTPASGDRFFIKARAVESDGTLSDPQIITCTVP